MPDRRGHFPSRHGKTVEQRETAKVGGEREYRTENGTPLPPYSVIRRGGANQRQRAIRRIAVAEAAEVVTAYPVPLVLIWNAVPTLLPRRFHPVRISPPNVSEPYGSPVAVRAVKVWRRA